jgi:YbbR domain-containing protein
MEAFEMKYTGFHWWLPKLICLIAACGLWIYVMNEQNPLVESSFTIPVQVKNLDRSMVALNVPKKVDIRIRMNRNDLMKLRGDDLEAYVDLRSASVGDFPNTPIRISVPGDGVVISESPSVFDLKIDAYTVRSVPVTVQYFGEAMKGYSASTGKLLPEAVTIAGGNTAVSSVDRAVVSIGIDGKKDNFDEFGSVNLLDASGNTVKDVETVPSQIKVSVVMKQARKTAVIPLKVGVTGNPADGYVVKKVTVSPSAVTVNGPSASVDAVHEIMAGTIDVSGGDRTVSRVISVPVPSGIDASPQSVSVSVDIEKAGEEGK